MLQVWPSHRASQTALCLPPGSHYICWTMQDCRASPPNASPRAQAMFQRVEGKLHGAQEAGLSSKVRTNLAM